LDEALLSATTFAADTLMPYYAYAYAAAVAVAAAAAAVAAAAAAMWCVFVRWRYDTFVNWEMWWPGFPILVYFKASGPMTRLHGTL
jgi:hypothetical protein